MIGERIKRARDAAGLSLRALAQEVGVSHAAISKYEKGQNTPSSAVLRAIARATGVRVEFFLRPDTVTLGQPEYRKRKALGKKVQRRIEAVVLEQAERFVELVQLYPHVPVPPFQVPEGVPDEVRTYDEVEEVADAVRAGWQLGQNPLPDLMGTLEEQGVLVLVIEGDDKGRFDGLAANLDGLPVVVVGADWPGDRQRFTMAHELGHLVLHERLADELDEERACNRFAGAFLAPRAAVWRELGRHRRTFIEPRELFVLKHDYGLSMQGWVFRAKDTGLISNAIATRLYKMFAARDWKRQEPGRPIPPERPHIFEQLVFHALAEGYFGESKAAELLGLSRAEFRARQRLESPHDAARQ